MLVKKNDWEASCKFFEDRLLRRTLVRLSNIDLNPEVSDTTGDAIGTKAGIKKNLHLTVIFLTLLRIMCKDITKR